MKTSFNSQFKKKSNNKGIFSPLASGFTQSVDFGITSQVFSINSIKKHIAQYLNVSLLHLRRRKNPMPKLTAGFTLIELLVVIAIIAILAAVILTSLTNSKTKANKTAAIATLKGVIPELLLCGDNKGYANTNNNSTPSATGTPIVGQRICVASNGLSTIPGHTATWPKLPTGWSYSASTNGAGVLLNSSFTYRATNGGTATVSCSFSNGVCQ